MSTLTLWLAAPALVTSVLVIALQIAYCRRVVVSERAEAESQGTQRTSVSDRGNRIDSSCHRAHGLPCSAASRPNQCTRRLAY